jgi:cytochrome c nitrite reductase small subunit
MRSDARLTRRQWFTAMTALVFLGTAFGIGLYTFVYAQGWSYLTNDPKACANCHVMNEQYESWLKSSHRSVAVCNDCHVPDNFIGKYYTKANHGFWHSFYFTTQTFHEPIRETAGSREVTEKRCRGCHGAVVQAMGTPAHAGSTEISCIRCHGSVGHMELSATSVGE